MSTALIGHTQKIVRLTRTLGILAVAEITIEGLREEIKSGGLWGVESDSNQSAIKEIVHDELSDLREQLHAVGFSKRAISAACKSIESEDE